jgi:hypothetical protein
MSVRGEYMHMTFMKQKQNILFALWIHGTDIVLVHIYTTYQEVEAPKPEEPTNESEMREEEALRGVPVVSICGTTHKLQLQALY